MSANPPPPEAPDPPGADPPDDELLAAELVLGVLGSAERASAEARGERDAAFSVHLARWERRFSPWLEEYPRVSAPAHLWPQICRRLGWQQTPALIGWWQSLALWRTAAALAALMAVALWFARPPPPGTATTPAQEAAAAKPVTTLVRADGSPGWLASVDRARGSVLMVPVPSAPDAQGRVPELWIIPAGQAPRSLGQVSINKSHTVSAPQDARYALVPGSVLAITLEPAAGMPHPAPSGPVIAKGAIQT
jgi:anti-sigma-K factor RskA